jgi:hypothetical protein
MLTYYFILKNIIKYLECNFEVTIFDISNQKQKLLTMTQQTEYKNIVSNLKFALTCSDSAFGSALSRCLHNDLLNEKLQQITGKKSRVYVNSNWCEVVSIARKHFATK